MIIVKPCSSFALLGSGCFGLRRIQLLCEVHGVCYSDRLETLALEVLLLQLHLCSLLVLKRPSIDLEQRVDRLVV